MTDRGKQMILNFLIIVFSITFWFTLIWVNVEDGFMFFNSNPIKISKVYYVNDRDRGLECYECDRAWKLKFLNESQFELWSYYGDKGQYQSCLSNGSYTYDNDSKTLTILNIRSRSAMNCVSRFKGKWKYSKDDLGLNAFISLNNSAWKFQTYGE